MTTKAFVVALNLKLHFRILQFMLTRRPTGYTRTDHKLRLKKNKLGLFSRWISAGSATAGGQSLDHQIVD